jgi:hypothetical protein
MLLVPVYNESNYNEKFCILLFYNSLKITWTVCVCLGLEKYGGHLARVQFIFRSGYQKTIQFRFVMFMFWQYLSNYFPLGPH